MSELIGGIIGGLGLFTIGMALLTANLKTLASRRLRQGARKWTENPFKALFWGTAVGTVTQSMSAFTFIVVGILRSGLITTKGALALILGGGVGVTLLVFVVTFDIKEISLYVLGVSAAAYVSGKLSKYRAIAGSFLGGAMIILGLALLKDAAAPLADQPWFEDLLQGTGASLVLSFLVGVLLTAIVQSGSAVCVFGISLATVGLISVDQTIMVIYGTCIGSSLILYILSGGLRGSSRQVAMYMVFYNILICVVFVPLFYLEINFDIPLMKALVLSIDADLDQQMAFLWLFLGVFPLPFMLAGLNLSVSLLERMWPRSQFDQLSRTRFIHDHASVDAETSLALIDLEQKRVIKIIPRYFETVRAKEDGTRLREAVGRLLSAIDDCINELQALHPTQGVELRNALMSRQKLLIWLEDDVGKLCETLMQLSDRSSLNQLQTSICEGVDSVILSLIEALETDDRMSWNIVQKLLGDRSILMRKLRSDYMETDPPLERFELMNIVLVTNLVESTFFFLSKLGKEYDPLSGRDEHVPH